VRLDKIMVDALRKIWDTADRHKVSLRTATFAVACERILIAREERGLYPTGTRQDCSFPASLPSRREGGPAGAAFSHSRGSGDAGLISSRAIIERTSSMPDTCINRSVRKRLRLLRSWATTLSR
jgi:hypothetical protein